MRSRVVGLLKWAYRDLTPMIAVALASVAVIGQSRELDDLQRARAITLPITCAASGATTEAVRAAVFAGSVLPGDRVVGLDGKKPDVPSGRFAVVSGELSRFLEAHGYPGPVERVALARAGAVAFALRNAEAIRREAGVVQGVVKSDGSLDCERLRELGTK